jgi:hypothetical protein
MAIDDVLQSLLAAPKTFLEANALVIYGSPKSKSGIKDFVLQAGDKTGWQTCVGGLKSVPFYIIYDAKGFNASATGPQSTAFNAHYVSMREFNADKSSWEDAQTTHYTLPGDGPAVMVTSKLNGCTFGIGSNAQGARLVSHLRPPNLQGSAGRLRLDEGTRAGFAGGKLDVGVMSSQGQNGTVLGLRTGSGWKFYAQRFQMFATAVGTITDVQVYG